MPNVDARWQPPPRPAHVPRESGDATGRQSPVERLEDDPAEVPRDTRDQHRAGALSMSAVCLRHSVESIQNKHGVPEEVVQGAILPTAASDRPASGNDAVASTP